MAGLDDAAENLASLRKNLNEVEELQRELALAEDRIRELTRENRALLRRLNPWYKRSDEHGPEAA